MTLPVIFWVIFDITAVTNLRWPTAAEYKRKTRHPDAFSYALDDGYLQGRQDSNLQPAVLETAALPIEPRPFTTSKRTFQSLADNVPPYCIAA